MSRKEDIRMEFDFNNMPKLNLDTTINLVNSINREQQESLKAVERVHEERRKREEQTLQATLETAENTAEMRVDLKEVIHNQNDYIRLLKYQNAILKNIFISGEDGVAIQKEIMNIMREQGMTDNTFKEKGLDVVIQSLFLAIQVWLKAKGIDF